MTTSVRRWHSCVLAGLLAATLAACSSSDTGPSNTNTNSTTLNGGAPACSGSATGTFTGSVNGANWTPTCVQVAIANGSVSVVATDGTTGVTLGFPASGGSFTVGPNQPLTGEVGVGATQWIAGGNSGSGTLTASMTSSTAVGNLNITCPQSPGAATSKVVVGQFNLKF